MFFFKISSAEEALRQFQPDMFRVYQAMSQSLANGKKSQAAFQFEDFADKIPHPLDPGRYVDNSIDYAIMTPLVAARGTELQACAVQNTQFRWTDLGQWDALRKVVKPDRKGNIRIGKTALKEGVRDSIFVAESGHEIEARGLSNIVAVFGRKTALVMHGTQISKLKEIAQEALKHPERLTMEHDVTDCRIDASGGRVIAIGLSNLSISLKGSTLRLWLRSKEAI